MRSSVLRRPGAAFRLAFLAAAVLAGAAARAQQVGETVEVHKGDTFYSIAARIEGGDPKNWHRLYDPHLSRLADPNLIHPGMRFDLVTDAGGRRYLRLVEGGATATATATAVAPAASAPRHAQAAAAAPAHAARPAAPAPAHVPPAPAAAPGPNDPITVGLLPSLAPATLITQYESVKSYLEKRGGGTKVNIVLPASFKAFFDALMRGDFDVAVAAPHFARVAQLDAGMVPLAMYEPRIGAQFIVPVDGTVNSVADLRGKTVAIANPTSLVAMYGMQWMRQHKLEPGKDFELVPARTELGVGRLLLSGEAVGAVMSGSEFRALPPDEAARLRIVEVFARIPNFIVLGHPRLGQARLAQLKTQWLGLLSDKDDGVAFARAAGLTGIVEVDEPILRELDPYVAPTRRAMGLAK